MSVDLIRELIAQLIEAVNELDTQTEPISDQHPTIPHLPPEIASIDYSRFEQCMLGRMDDLEARMDAQEREQEAIDKYNDEVAEHNDSINDDYEEHTDHTNTTIKTHTQDISSIYSSLHNIDSRITMIRDVLNHVISRIEKMESVLED